MEPASLRASVVVYFCYLSVALLVAYTSGYHRYTDFCSRCSYQPLVPTSESILSQFVSYLGQQQLKHKIMKSYLASICFFHIIDNII